MSLSVGNVITDDFKEALQDYYYLLNRGFPQKGSLKLTGDKYRLSKTQRAVLYRGITSKKIAISRTKKLSKEAISGILHVDVFNVLYSIYAYLKGDFCFISNDSFLRDVSEQYGKQMPDKLITRSSELLAESLVSLSPGEIFLHIDNPLPDSGLVKNILEKQFKESMQKIHVISSPSADQTIASVDKGIIISSDSEIIDRLDMPFFDLPHYSISKAFEPKILDLRSILI